MRPTCPAHVSLLDLIAITVSSKQYVIIKVLNTGGCIQKFPDWVDNEIYAYNNTHSLRSNTKGYGGKTH
jgi:hypothetical protein